MDTVVSSPLASMPRASIVMLMQETCLSEIERLDAEIKAAQEEVGSDHGAATDREERITETNGKKDALFELETRRANLKLCLEWIAQKQELNGELIVPGRLVHIRRDEIYLIVDDSCPASEFVLAFEKELSKATGQNLDFQVMSAGLSSFKDLKKALAERHLGEKITLSDESVTVLAVV